MVESELYVGAHWRDDRWLAVVYDDRSFDHATVAAEIGALWGRYGEAAQRVLVDVPIGLVEDGDPERAPDAAARSVLGPRADAVLTPPVREATRKRRYPVAARVNERRADAALSEAAFAASDGIAAVDELLRELPEARSVLAAAHPEVCYRAFLGEPLEYEPTIAGGYAERMRAMNTYDAEAPPIVQKTAEATDGEPVAVWDVLDAVALGLTARPGPATLRSLPPEPPVDDEGLPMQYVYRAEKALAVT